MNQKEYLGAKKVCTIEGHQWDTPCPDCKRIFCMRCGDAFPIPECPLEVTATNHMNCPQCQFRVTCSGNPENWNICPECGSDKVMEVDLKDQDLEEPVQGKVYACTECGHEWTGKKPEPCQFQGMGGICTKEEA